MVTRKPAKKAAARPRKRVVKATRAQKVLAVLRSLFTRPVRAALYTAALAVVAAAVGAGALPAWTLAPAAPMLLALLHLSPDDVDGDTGA